MKIIEIPIDQIVVKDRARKDHGNLDELMDSIKRKGLLHPICIDLSTMRLLSGERRLICCKMLGFTTVPVRPFEDLDEIERLEIELDENIHKSFDWAEQAELTSRIHDLKLKLYGIDAKRGSKWTLEKTAQSIGIPESTLSENIALSKAIESYPGLRKLKSRKQAIKAMVKIREMAILTELASRDIEKTKEALPYTLYNMDSVDCLKQSFEDETVDMVIFDPPWGIDIDTDGSGRGPMGDEVIFDDSFESAMILTKSLLPEIYRVLKNNTHMYMFFGIEHIERIKKMVREVGFSIREVPLIWAKEGGAFTDIEVRFMPQYENILFCSKGLRRINYPCGDVFQINRPINTERIHTQQKPISLLQRFIKLSTVPGEIVLDPCMGSGASVVASLRCKRRAAGIELNKEAFIQAKTWISGIKLDEDIDIEVNYV